MAGGLVGWLVGWLAGWLWCLLAGWLAGWLVGWLAGWLCCLLVGWLLAWFLVFVDWLAGYFNGFENGSCHSYSKTLNYRLVLLILVMLGFEH